MNAAKAIPSFTTAARRGREPAGAAAAGLERAPAHRGIVLMGRLRVWQKLALIVLASAVPLAVALWALAASMRGPSANPWARNGVAYQAQVLRLLQAMQGHRDLAVAGRSDSALRAKVGAQRQEIEERMQAIDAASTTLGASVRRTEEWTRAKQQVGEALAARGTGDDPRAHTAAIETLLGLLALVGDEEGVRFDPQPVAHYLADVVSSAAPALSELIARLRTEGGTFTRRAITEDDVRELQGRLTLLRYQSERVKSDLATLAGADDGLRQLLEKVRQAHEQAVAQFADTVQARLLHPREVTVTTAAWWEQASRALERTAGVADVSASILSELLEQRQHRHASDRQRALLCVLAAVLVAAAVCFVVIRDLHQPLSTAVRAAERMADGDLSTPVDGRGRTDEIGRLGAALDDIAGALEAIVHHVDQLARGDLSFDVRPRSPADAPGAALAAFVASYRSLMQLLSNGVGALTAASGDVLRGVADVTGGASHAVAAADVAAAAVQAVRRTAILASEQASELSDDAQAALRVSHAGSRAADDVVAGLNRVQEQLHAIATSVVRLGEHSRAIGDIMAAVDGLAERANLLAVNASIEVAKAGEHGQGFAVVANDVRSVAEQATQASAHVRTLLSDVQKAANVAVMVTEQGAKSAEAGVKQSLDGGVAFRQLARQIADAAEAVGRVTSSSEQQLAGIEQAMSAVQRVKDASAQHVDGMRRIEAAAQNLVDVSAQIQDLLSHYRLQGERSAA